MMEYKGYTARIDFDDSIESFHGRILGIRDVITFEGKTVNALKKAFREAVEDYLDWCLEEGRTPEKPVSGKLQLRLGPELHRMATIMAENRGESLNTFLTSCVERVILLEGSLTIFSPAPTSSSRKQSTTQHG